MALIPALFAQAQAQSGLAKAKQMLEWIIQGQGDSIHVHMAPHVRDKVKPQEASTMLGQLEMMAGKFQSAADEWQTETREDGEMLYINELQFEATSLIFRLTLNKEEKIAGLWFRPGKPNPATLPHDSTLQTNTQRAQRLFELVKAGRGEEAYDLMNEEVRIKISPEVLSSTFAQSERMYGKFQRQTEWDTEHMGGQAIYTSDIHFEKDGLRLMISFDPQGKATSMLFYPLPEGIEVEPIVLNAQNTREEDIEIVTGNYKLPGTLTLPTHVKNPPVAILVHGSGPSDRNQTIGPNATLRDLAWGLANRGIAVIRYDKRTLVYAHKFASQEDATYDDESVDDALSAVRLARAHKKLAKSNIYIIGHSLGAMLAPRMAERDTTLAGIILLAGPARTMDEVLPEQMTYLYTFSGMTQAAQKEIDNIKLQFANARKLNTDDFDPSIPLPLNLPKSYLLFDHAYKPVEVARKLTLPILILQGERDYQVTMQDYGLWRMGLYRNRNVQFKSYPKLNHHFQEGSGKSMPTEYYKKNVVASYVLDDIAHWMRTRKIDDK